MFYIRISLVLFTSTILSSCYADGTIGTIQKASDGIDLLKAGVKIIENKIND